ncbi:hypothetical protein C8Q80DRAFT_392831 [Daedaleopsis nitida]|nr:hypothetical protein C8Q80DRAFT_392831 [Daedaleopsis nitida]
MWSRSRHHHHHLICHPLLHCTTHPPTGVRGGRRTRRFVRATESDVRRCLGGTATATATILDIRYSTLDILGHLSSHWTRSSSVISIRARARANIVRAGQVQAQARTKVRLRASTSGRQYCGSRTRHDATSDRGADINSGHARANIDGATGHGCMCRARASAHPWPMDVGLGPIVRPTYTYRVKTWQGWQGWQGQRHRCLEKKEKPLV